MPELVDNSGQPSRSSPYLALNTPNQEVASAGSTPPESHRLSTIGIHYKASTEIIDFALSNNHIFVATRNTAVLLSAASSVLISRQSFKSNILRVGAAPNDTCLYVVTDDGVLYVLQTLGRPHNNPSVRAIDLVHSSDTGSCVDLAIANRTTAYAPVVQLNRTVSEVHMEIDPINPYSFMLSFRVEFSPDLKIPSFNTLLYCNNLSQITSYHLRNRITAMHFGNLGLSFIGDITGRVYILMTSESLRDRVQNQQFPASNGSPRVESRLASFIFFERIYPEHIKRIHLLSPVTLFLGYIDGMMLTINLKTKIVMKHDIACTNTYQSGKLKTKITGKPGIKARVLLGSDPLLGKFCISKHTEAQKRTLRGEQPVETTGPQAALNNDPVPPSQASTSDFLAEYIKLKEQLAKENAEGVMQELLDTFVEEWEYGPAQRQASQFKNSPASKQSPAFQLPRPSVILTKGFESSQIASIDEYLVLFTCFKGYLVAFNLTAYDNAISRPIYLEDMTTSGLYKYSATEKLKSRMQLHIHKGRLLVSMANTIHTISLPQFLLPLISYTPRFGNYRFYSQGERDILGNSEEDYPYDVRMIFEAADVTQQSSFMKGCKELGEKAIDLDPMIDLSVKTAICASATDQFMDAHLYQEGGTPTNRSGSIGQGVGALSKNDPRSPVQLLKQLREKRMKTSPSGRALSTPKLNEDDRQFRMVLSDKVALADAHLRVARESLIREKMLEQIMRRFEYGQDSPDNYLQLSPRQGSYDRYKRIASKEVDRYDHTHFLPVTNLSGDIIKGRHRHVHSLNFEKDYFKVIDDKMKQPKGNFLHNTIDTTSQKRSRENDGGLNKSTHSDTNLALSDLMTDSLDVLSQSSSTFASVSGDSFQTPQRHQDSEHVPAFNKGISDQNGDILHCNSQHTVACDNSMRPVVDLGGQSPSQSINDGQNNLLLNDLDPLLSTCSVDKQTEQSISNVINRAMLLPEIAEQQFSQSPVPPPSSDAARLEERKIDSIVSFILSTHKHSEVSHSESPALRSRSPASAKSCWPCAERVSQLYSVSKLLSRNRAYASMASAMVHILKMPRQDTTSDRIDRLLKLHKGEKMFRLLAQTGLFTDQERAILSETLDDARFYYQQLGFPAMDINQIKPSTVEGVSQWKGYLDSHGILPHTLANLKPDMYFRHPGRNITSAISTRRIPKVHRSGIEPSFGTPDTQKQEQQGPSKDSSQSVKELTGLQVFSLQPSSSASGSSSLRKNLLLSTGSTTVVTAPPSSAPHSLSIAKTSTVLSSKSKECIYPAKSNSSPVTRDTSLPVFSYPQESLPADISVAVYSEDNHLHPEEVYVDVRASQQLTQSNTLADSRKESRPTNSCDNSLDSSTSIDSATERSNTIVAAAYNDHRIFRSSPKSSQLFDSHFLKETLRAPKSDSQTLRPKLRPPDILYPITSSDHIEEHKVLSASTSSALQPLLQTARQRPLRPSSLPSSRLNQRKSATETLTPRETHHAWLRSRAQTKSTVRVTVFTGIPKYYDTRTRIEYAHKHQFNMMQQRDLTDSVEPVGSLVYKTSRPASVQEFRHVDGDDAIHLSIPQIPLEAERHGSNLLTDDGSFMSTTQQEKKDLIHRPGWSASETFRKTTKVANDGSILSAIEFYPMPQPDANDVKNGPTLVNLNQQLTHIIDSLAARMYGEKEKHFLARYTDSVTSALVKQARLINAQGKSSSPNTLDNKRVYTSDRRPSTGTPMHQGVLLDRGIPLSSLAKLSSALGNIVYKLTIMRQAAYRQSTEEEAIEARNDMWNAAVTEINKAFPNMLHVSSEQLELPGAHSPEKIAVNINNKDILYSQPTERQISPVKEKVFKEPQRLTWRIGAANLSSAGPTAEYRYLHDTETRIAGDPGDRSRPAHSHVTADGVQSAKYMRSLAQARARFAPYSLKDVLQVFSYLDVGVGANGEIRSLSADRLTKVYRADSDIYGCADNEESDGEPYHRAGSGARYPSLQSQQVKESLDERRSTSFRYSLPRGSIESLSEILPQPQHELQTNQVTINPPAPINKQTRDLHSQRIKKKSHPLLEDASLVQTILADLEILPAQHTFDSQDANTSIQVKRKDLTRLLLRMVDDASQHEETKILEPLLPQVVRNDSVFKEQLLSFLYEKRGLVEQHAIRVQDLMQTQKRFEDMQERAISLQTMQKPAERVVYESKVSLMESTGKSICEQLRDTNQPLEISTVDLVNMNVTKYSDKPSVLLHSVVFSPMKFRTMRERALAAKKRIQEKQSLDIPDLIIPSVFTGPYTGNVSANIPVKQVSSRDELHKAIKNGSRASKPLSKRGQPTLSTSDINLTLVSDLPEPSVQARNINRKDLQDRHSYASDSMVSLSVSIEMKPSRPDELLAPSLKSPRAMTDLSIQQCKDFNFRSNLPDSIVKTKSQTDQYQGSKMDLERVLEPARPDIVTNVPILGTSSSTHQAQSLSNRAPTMVKSREQAPSLRHSEIKDASIVDMRSVTPFDSAPEVGLAEEVSAQSRSKTSQELTHSISSRSLSAVSFPSDTLNAQSYDSFNESISGKGKEHGPLIPAISSLAQDSVHSGLPPRPSSGALRPAVVSPRPGHFSSIHEHIKNLQHPSELINLSSRDRGLLLSMSYRSPYNLRCPEVVFSALGIKVPSKTDTPPLNATGGKRRSTSISPTSNLSSAPSTRRTSKSSSFSYSRSSSPAKWSDDSDTFVGTVIAQMRSLRASSKKPHYRGYRYGTLTPTEGFSTHPGRSRSCCDLLGRTRDGYMCAVQTCFLDFQSHDHTQTDPRLSADVFFSELQVAHTITDNPEPSEPNTTPEQDRSFSKPMLPFSSLCSGSAAIPHIPSQFPSINLAIPHEITVQPRTSVLSKESSPHELFSIQLRQVYRRYLTAKDSAFKRDASIFKSQQLIVLSEHMTSLSKYLYPLTQKILYADYHGTTAFGTYTETEMYASGLKKYGSYFYYNMPQWATESSANITTHSSAYSRQRLDSVRFVSFLQSVFPVVSKPMGLMGNSDGRNAQIKTDTIPNQSTTTSAADMIYPEGRRPLISYARYHPISISITNHDDEIFKVQNLSCSTGNVLLIPPRSKSARKSLIDRYYVRQRPTPRRSHGHNQSMSFQASRSSSPSYHSDLHRSFTILSGRSFDTAPSSALDSNSTISNKQSKPKHLEGKTQRKRSFEELRRLERYSCHSISKDKVCDDCNMYYSINQWKYSISKNCCVHRPLPNMTLFGRRWEDSHGAAIPSAETRSVVQRRIRSRIQCSKMFKTMECILQDNYKRFYPDVSYYTLGAYNIRQYSPISSSIPPIYNLLQKRVKSSQPAKDFLETSISDEEFIFNGVYTHKHESKTENCCFAFETSLISASKVAYSIESCFNKKLIIDITEKNASAAVPQSKRPAIQRRGPLMPISQTVFNGFCTEDPRALLEASNTRAILNRQLYNHERNACEKEQDSNADSFESPILRLSLELHNIQEYIHHLYSLRFSSAQLASVTFPSGLRFSSIDCIGGPIEASFLSNLNAQYWGLIKSWDQAYSNNANLLTSATSAYVMVAERTKNIMLFTLGAEQDTTDNPEAFLKNLLTCRYDKYKYNRLRAQEEQLYEVCPDTLPDLSRIGHRRRNKIMSKYDVFGRGIASKAKGRTVPERQKKISNAVLLESAGTSHACDQTDTAESQSAITPVSFSEKSTYRSLLGPSICDGCLSENKEIGGDVGSSSVCLTHVFTVDIQKVLCRSLSKEGSVGASPRRGYQYSAQELTREIVVTRGTHSLAGHISLAPTTETSRTNRKRPNSARSENHLSGIKTCINTFVRSQALCRSRQLPIYLMEIIILQASESLACSLSHVFRHREAAGYFKTVVEKEFVPVINKPIVSLNDLPPCTVTSGFAHAIYGSDSVLDTYSLLKRKAESGTISIYDAARLGRFVMLPIDYIDYRAFLLYTKALNKHIMDVSAVLQSQRVVKSLEARDEQLSRLMESTRAYSNDMAPCYELWNRLVFNMHHVLNVRSVGIYSEQFEKLLKQHNGELDLLIEKALTLNSEYYTKHPAIFKEYQVRRRQKESEYKAELERIRYLMMEVMRNWRLHGPIYNISGLLLISYRGTAAFKEALQRYFPVANEDQPGTDNLEPALNMVPFGTGEMPITARDRSKEGEASERSDKTLLLSYRSTRPTTGTSHNSNSNRFVPSVVSERELDIQYRTRHLLLSRLVLIELSARIFETQHKNNMLTAIQYMIPDDLDSIFSQLPSVAKGKDPSNALFKQVSTEALASGNSKIGVYDYMHGVSADEMETKEIRKTLQTLENQGKDTDASENISTARDATVLMAKELSRPSTALPVSDIKLTIVRDTTPSPLVSSPTKTVALAIKMNNLDMLARDIKQRLDKLQKGDLDEFDGSIIEFVSQSESFFSICDAPDMQTKLDDLPEEQSSTQEPSGTLNKKGRRVTISDDSHAPSAPQVTSSSSRPVSGSNLKPLSATKGPLNVVQLNMSLDVKQRAARLTIDSLRSRGMKTPHQDKDLGRILQKLTTTENSALKNASLLSDSTPSREDSIAPRTLSAVRQANQTSAQTNSSNKRKGGGQSCVPDSSPVTRDFSSISTAEKKTTSQSSRLSSIRSAGIRLPRHIEKTLEAGAVADMTPNYFSLNSSLQASLSSQEDTGDLNNLFIKCANPTNTKEVSINRCQSSVDRSRIPNNKKSAKKFASISISECEYRKSTSKDGLPMTLTGVSVQKSIHPEVLIKAKRQVELLPRNSVNNSANQSICSADHAPDTLSRPASSFETGYRKDIGRNPWKRGSTTTSHIVPQPKYLSQSHIKDLIASTSTTVQGSNVNLTESELAHIEALGRRRLKPENGSTWTTIGGIARPGSGIGMRAYSSRKRSSD